MFCNWSVISASDASFIPNILHFNTIGASGEGKLSQKLNRLVVCHEMNLKIDWSQESLFTLTIMATLFD